MSTPPETGFALHVPRAMLRYGPYKSKSRKRRRHRIRQWRAEQVRIMCDTVVDYIGAVTDPDSKLPMMVALTRRISTGIESRHFELMMGSAIGNHPLCLLK